MIEVNQTTLAPSNLVLWLIIWTWDLMDKLQRAVKTVVIGMQYMIYDLHWFVNTYTIILICHAVSYNNFLMTLINTYMQTVPTY